MTLGFLFYPLKPKFLPGSIDGFTVLRNVGKLERALKPWTLNDLLFRELLELVGVFCAKLR